MFELAKVVAMRYRNSQTVHAIVTQSVKDSVY